MPRPRPTPAYHFTHVDHLESIVRDGLVCDSAAHVSGRLAREVGNQAVKARRREKQVDVAPGGVVADYVPLYFAPRNLMLFQLHTNQVSTYTGGQEGLIFLCATLEDLAARGLPWVVSDRNAATTLATFTSDVSSLDEHVDWDLATTSSFGRTPEDPDRPQRHQAELLVYQQVPWEAIAFIGTRDRRDLARANEVLGSLDVYQPRRDVRPHWYF